MKLIQSMKIPYKFLLLHFMYEIAESLLLRDCPPYISYTSSSYICLLKLALSQSIPLSQDIQA